MGNFSSWKNCNLSSNENMKEEHLGIKDFHLNRKGNDAFAETLSNFAEWKRDFSH